MLVQEPASIQHPQLSPPANRVSTLTPASIQFLTDIGAWPNIAPPRSAAFSRMQVWDSTGSGFIQYNAATLSEVTMGHAAENGVIQYALMQRLRPNVHNMWPVSVNSNLDTAHNFAAANTQLRQWQLHCKQTAGKCCDDLMCRHRSKL